MKPTLPEPVFAGELSPHAKVYFPADLRRLVDAAYEAGKADAREWLPIESAPKKETFLAVLYCGGEQTICTMRWPVAEAKNSRPETSLFHVERVTHWMPLPPPPEQPK